MKIRWRTVFTTTLALVLLFGFSGCKTLGISFGNRPPRSGGSPGEYRKAKGGPPPWAPAHGYRAKHQYRYYPGQKVYYDDSRGVYFYYHDGEWDISANLPVDININLGDYVTLDMDTDRPYIYHSDVEARYSGKKTKGKSKKKSNYSAKKYAKRQKTT